MNKRIYFADKFIELFDKDNSEIAALQGHTSHVATHTKKKLKSMIDKFLTEKSEKGTELYAVSLGEIIDCFKSHFHYIEAAGGFIENSSKYLFIRRHQLWDLPKGKLEKLEGIKHAAIRECEEECGIQNLSVVKSLSSTFHIYPYKESFALKQSYWFYMHSNFAGKLTPQIEEHITDVRWFSKEDILKTVLNDTYFTISDVVKEALMLSK